MDDIMKDLGVGFQSNLKFDKHAVSSDSLSESSVQSLKSTRTDGADEVL